MKSFVFSIGIGFVGLGLEKVFAFHSSMPQTFEKRADLEQSYLLPNQSELQMDVTRPFADTLRCRGVARVDNGLSYDTAMKLQSLIDETLESSIDEVENFRAPRNFRFANVLEKANRWDLLLPFDEGSVEDRSSDVVLQAMSELVGNGGKIGHILDEMLGEDAILYEFACLISDPGSSRQEIHPDIVFSNVKIPLIACFVSLQDIDFSMGPTVFIPDTVTADAHERINDENLADDMLQCIPSCISTLGTGDCSLYNPMVLHAGGGNVSDRRRRLFYFTFLDPSIQDPSSHLNPGSINPVLKQKNMTLKDVREVLNTM